MTKKAKKTKKNPKIPSPGRVITRGEWLETVIKLTNQAISGATPVPEIDQALIEQSEKYSKELKEWRKNESKN